MDRLTGTLGPVQHGHTAGFNSLYITAVLHSRPQTEIDGTRFLRREGWNETA